MLKKHYKPVPQYVEWTCACIMTVYAVMFSNLEYWAAAVSEMPR